MEESNFITAPVEPDCGRLAKNTLWLVAIVGILGGFLLGYDTAVINGANQYLKIHFSLDPVREGMAGASAIFGCIPGAMFAGFLSDYFGRKKLLFVCAILYAVSGLLSAIPNSFNQFLLARFISGLGIGASSMICPVYLTEMAPAAWRGRLGSLFQFGIVSGIFVSLFINAWIQSHGDDTWNTSAGWRWMLGAEIAPAIPLLACLFFVPESPRWLAQKSGAGTLEITPAAPGDGQSANVFARRFRRPLLIGIVLMAISQFSGINAIMYYSTKILTTAGVGVKDSFAASAVIGLVNLLFTVVAMTLVDKAGRRPLLLVGLFVQAVALGAVGWMFHANIHGFGLLLAILGFIAAFAMALGPIPWILCSEIFPTQVRGRAMSISTFVIWTSCYIVAQTFPVLNDSPQIGPARTFWIYAIFSVLGFLFTFALVPETKGRSLEEVGTQFH